MTAPAKKSGSGRKSPAGKKTAGQRTASRKPASRKNPPRKKRTRKKGKQLGLAKPLGLAFFAGLILASAVFWYLRDMRVSGPEVSPPKEKTIATATKPSASVNRAPRNDRATRPKTPPTENEKKGSESPPVREKAQQSSGPSDNGGTPTTPAKKTPDRETPAAREQDSAQSAVAGALHDLQGLAYEESLHVSLEERIRQVNYALAQAAWMRNMPASSLRIAFVEKQNAGQEQYRHQHMDILTGPSSASTQAFIASLRETLGLWADGATLDKQKNEWVISLDKEETHRLRLYHGKELPPLPDSAPTPDRDGKKSEPRLAEPRLRDQDEPPKLVLVIDDLGASASAVNRLLALDYPLTFAFWPHGAHTRSGARAAHAKGQEILVHQPMEPLGYPNVAPGPNTLLVGMKPGEIREILKKSIAAVPHAVGLNNHMGSRFTQNAAGVDVVIELLREQGLFLLDSLTHGCSVFAGEGKRLGLRHYRRNVFLDVTPKRSEVLKELRRAERIALLTGQAVAIGHPLPATLEALEDWQRLRDRRVKIVRLRDLPQQ